MKPHTRNYFIDFKSIIFLLTLFNLHSAVAQSPASVLENRLSKTWKLSVTVQGDQSSGPDHSLSDFVMILNADHTARQGMSPDGLIGGKWNVDEKTMMLTIKDDVTNMEYKMKI